MNLGLPAEVSMIKTFINWYWNYQQYFTCSTQCWDKAWKSYDFTKYPLKSRYNLDSSKSLCLIISFITVAPFQVLNLKFLRQPSFLNVSATKLFELYNHQISSKVRIVKRTEYLASWFSLYFYGCLLGWELQEGQQREYLVNATVHNPHKSRLNHMKLFV